MEGEESLQDLVDRAGEVEVTSPERAAALYKGAVDAGACARVGPPRAHAARQQAHSVPPLRPLPRPPCS
jgi:hypothetical protein